MYYLKFSISIAFISWLVGMILNSLVKDRPVYSNLSNLDFIKKETLTKILGLDLFKWVVINTPFKFFNQRLKWKNKIELAQLIELRKEMTISEISHLIGFGFVVVFAIDKFFKGQFLFALVIMIVNTLMNLYPSLLQQVNKRRIDKI